MNQRPNTCKERRGCPRKHSRCQPKLADLLLDEQQCWHKVTIWQWYDQNNRQVEVLTSRAI